MLEPIETDNMLRTEELSAAKRKLLQQRMRGDGKYRGDGDLILPRAPGAPVPISAEQHRIWLHASTRADLPVYNEPITIHRHGSFNIEALEASFNEILRRHEAWRTSFAIVDEKVMQIVHPTLRVSLSTVDLNNLSPEERESEALRLATSDAAVPIRLDTAPLFRAHVLRMSPIEHRLYLTLHHIIFDGVSIYRIFMPELAAIYAEFAEGKPKRLVEPVLQYGDYAIWRDEHKSSAAVTRHLEYWKKELSGELPVLRLPTDRPRPSQMSHHGAMECFRLSAELVNSLRSLSRVHGVTLYMTLLAAFKVLLFRYSAQEDLIVGGVTDARRRTELEGLMGYFLDTFALRTHPSAERLFSEYLMEVRDSVLGALAAADVPFDLVVQAVQPKRDSSYHPVFQAFFSIEPPVAPFAEGWDLTQMEVTTGSSKFDIYLELDERPDHMAARLMYNTDIFDAGSVRRMAGHWQVLLDAVCHNPDCTLGTLPFLTSCEIAELTGPTGWNDTVRASPLVTLHRLIMLQACQTPDSYAVEFEGVRCTYRELMDRAEALENDMRAAGVRRGSIVAVFLRRSIDLLAGMVAVLKTGAAYLPLDPETPPARIALCLDETRPVAVLTQSSLRFELPNNTTGVLLVDVMEHEEAISSQPLEEEIRIDDIAYVIHTSGTTGRPKVVEISHASVVNLLTSMQAEPGFGARDTLLAVTTVSFDIAALELFLPLISGGRVVIASREVAQDPYLLAAAIESSGCTVMQATPSTWRALVSIGWRGPERTLRVLCGGEPLPRDLAERLLEAKVELWNMYGPTETTIWSAVHHVRSGVGPVLIGKPIANTTAYILDQQKQLLPVGVAGDLYLGGSGLARGYRGLPEMTSDRFVTAHAVDRARLYYTGDLAVRHADGNIECLGRTDNQVKVRGFRLELEAVEAAVMRHPQIAAAAARVWPDISGGMRLSVYIVGREGAPPDRSSLRQFLHTDLPDYMIPSDVIAMNAIPLTPNGKTDRASLPSPVPCSGEHARTEPTTSCEQQLALIWADLLKVKAVGVQDDFFELGGHSLLVATLQQRIAVAFGCQLSMADIFHAPTVQQQAALLKYPKHGDPALSGLIMLQRQGGRSNLFWLHPPPLIRNLASAMGNDQPLFGVGLTRTDVGSMQDGTNMKTIAARHVQTILKAQPQGPFYLGGLCTGGIVAFETASQLEEAGYKVGLLILLDSQNPFFYRRIGSPTVELNKCWFYLRQAYKNTGPNGRVTLRERLLYRARQIWPPEFAPREMIVGEHMTDLAAYRYKPTVYRGDVLLIQPTDRPSRVDHLPAWRAVISGLITAKNVAGHHDELLHPRNVRNVAEVISLHLAEIVSPRH